MSFVNVNIMNRAAVSRETQVAADIPKGLAERNRSALIEHRRLAILD